MAASAALENIGRLARMRAGRSWLVLLGSFRVVLVGFAFRVVLVGFAFIRVVLVGVGWPFEGRDA